MGLIRGRNWWWNFFKNLLFDLHTTTRGYLQLGYGMHEVQVPLDHKINPLGVYLNCRDQTTPICAGQISMASATLLCDSFIIHANIQSTSCLIEWLVEYDPIFSE